MLPRYLDITQLADIQAFIIEGADRIIDELGEFDYIVDSKDFAEPLSDTDKMQIIAKVGAYEKMGSKLASEATVADFEDWLRGVALNVSYMTFETVQHADRWGYTGDSEKTPCHADDYYWHTMAEVIHHYLK